MSSAVRQMCVVAFAACAAGAHAQVSPNGQIAYVVCTSEPMCDIWVMNADGSGQTNLTNTPDQYEYAPAWSPDGTRIAYANMTTGELWAIDADGTSPLRITADGTSPTWSPAGGSVAFVRSNPGAPVTPQQDVMVVDLSTMTEVVVSGLSDFGGVLLMADEFEPAWSPDGGRIAYVGVRWEQYFDPGSGEPEFGAQHEIATANPDGSDELVLTTGEPGSDRANYLEEDRGPAWSPDGAMLVFMSQAQIPACCGPWQIWAVNRDGSGIANLSASDTNDMFPSWSPDGAQIVFQRANGAGGFDVYTMPAPPSLPEALRLTTNGRASDPAWGRNRALPLPARRTQSLYVTLKSTSGRVPGSVASAAIGIKCGRDCKHTYPTGRRVDLTATPRAGYRFVEWAGACAGSAPACSVTMNDVKLVQASFARDR